ncbi:MAG TPA: putative ABC exporter domain-containing protein [Candidatus Blautia pullicola]|uniref:ABC exporter domain-containing protein n=1 Tax=Candidatus Blautia pullicola TaxID=2838498 RepID=A0A9D2FU23_9FIRM|nr:putative ABC exporter domain-containing protein [Candidatus Blautia pullicola]
MNSLLYLAFLKVKGLVRNQFRTPGSAIISVLMILLYGGLVFMSFFFSSDQIPQEMLLDTNGAILAGIGMTALLSVTLLLNKRKALVYDTDAYYLFAGPYTRKQVNMYILLQSFTQGALYSLLGCFMTAMFSMGGYLTVPFFLVLFLSLTLMLIFFLTLTDYIYMWSLLEPRHKKWYVVPVLLLLVPTAAIFLYEVWKSDFVLQGGFMNFALSKEFYLVPFMGWAKLAMNSFMEGEYLYTLLSLLLLLACCLVMAGLFLRFRGEITEQAVEDAQEVTAYVKRAKANGGRARVEDGKVKNVKGEFAWGARAVLSKNLLLMRKTGNFLRKQDIGIIVFYFALSWLILPENTFYMFCYMLLIWMFTLINDSDLLRDLKNYQIYLIPDSAFKKLVYAMLPAYLKIGLIAGVSIIFAGILTRMSPGAVVQYLVMVLGYSMIFVAGTVLSVRILGSRTNIMLESFLRMVIVLASAIPSAAAGIFLFVFLRVFQIGISVMTLVSLITLVMNFLVSLLIIVACKGMMNGREL